MSGPTLQTVADALGISRSTVSNAYSRPDQLSPELRERILQTARRLGYAGPNPTARSLRSGRAGAIGVLFTSSVSLAFTDPFAVRFLRGLAESAEQARTGVLLIGLAPQDDDAGATTVRDAAVDGFCTFCLPRWHRALEVVAARGLPTVTTDLDGLSVPGAMCVGVNESAATLAAGRHLTALGHRRVAVIADWLTMDRHTEPLQLAEPEQVSYAVSRDRLRGYRDAFAEVGVPWTDLTVVNAATNSRADGAAAAALVLDRAPRPTAVVALTDLLALGVLDAMATRGLRPGHDVSVIGFDDIPDAGTARLTTIHQPAQEKGRLAGSLLLDPPADPAARRVVLPTDLVVRASTGPAPA